MLRSFTLKLELVSDILQLIVSGNPILIITRPRPLQTYFFDNFGNSKAFETALT